MNYYVELAKWLKENSSGVYRKSSEAATIIERAIELKSMDNESLRLRFGELTNDEILCVKATLNQILPDR
jgi:hypothetical protein